METNRLCKACILSTLKRNDPVRTIAYLSAKNKNPETNATRIKSALGKDPVIGAHDNDPFLGGHKTF